MPDPATLPTSPHLSLRSSSSRREIDTGCHAARKTPATYVESILRRFLAASPGVPADASEPGQVSGQVFGDPLLTPVSVGHRAFKALVQEAYGRRLAVTGDRIVPVVQAVHIRPVTEAGENRVDNGLLLRSDVHTCSTADTSVCTHSDEP